MGFHWPSFWGGFIGKVVGAIFVAACILLGFGPDKWVKFMIQELPQWFTPNLARAIFLFLAAMVFIILVVPYFLYRRKSIPEKQEPLSPEPTSAPTLEPDMDIHLGIF